MTVAYVGGIASRSESYMKLHWDHAKGLAAPGALEAQRRSEEQEHIRLQTTAGLDFVSPAYVAWEDILRPWCKPASGVEAGQLTRYFETNTFFREPHVTAAPASQSTAFDAWFAGFQIPAGTAWVLTLPSPWDFALRSKNESGLSLAQLALAGGKALQPVVEEAFRRGAALVQFHDPSIIYPRAPQRDIAAFHNGLAAAAGGRKSSCTLHLSNGNPFDFPEVLTGNPLGGLSIEDPGQTKVRITLPNGTRLSVALVRGEESLIESPAAIARRGREIAASLGVPLWGITNGWDLAHVPHAIACKKIQALGEARRLSQEVIA